jgi:hypothetical protein
MTCNVRRGRSIRRVTSHLPVGSLIYSDIVDQHLSRPCQIGKVDGLEIIGHSKVDDLARALVGAPNLAICA